MALLEKIKSEEIEFMEMFHNPIALIEALFSNFDNLQEFDEDKFGDLRTYQYPLISFEPIIDTNLPNITQKEKFNLRKNVGDCVAFGARRFGKSLCVLKLDMPISMLHDDGWGVACTSLDSIHLDGILDSVRDAIENHPILKLWKKRIIKSPRWKITALNNWNLLGINMNLNSKNPGNAWFGKHVKKIYIEEASFETEKIYGNRQDALSELGAVVRTSGMCNFTKSSPAGKTFYALENRSKVVNLPQFVNPFWGEKEKENRLKEFGGENSINYRVFVKGEVVEDGISAFDMDRVKLSYNEKKVIKRFEITKENYGYFENLIVVERPKNAERLMIAADIGESAGSEIIILSEVGDKFNYLYNITLYNLTDEEQYEIFKWLIGKLEANVVSLDCGDGQGRAIYRRLEKIYSKDNLVWYDGSKKINIDFEKDDKGNILLKSGVPIYRQEIMAEWSVRRLKALLYEEHINIPLDYKLHKQLSSVISMKTGTRTIYRCISEQDHLFDAFRVFAIAEWLKKSFNDTPKMQTNYGTGISTRI